MNVLFYYIDMPKGLLGGSLKYITLTIYQLALFTLIVICINSNYLHIAFKILFLKSCPFPAII